MNQAPAISGATAVHATATEPVKAQPQESTLQKVEGGFVHVMQWITGAGKVALSDIIAYTPDAVDIAEMLLPAYKQLESGIGQMVVQACQLLLTGIVNAQQKYAADANVPGAQKSQDVLLSVGGTVISILGLAKIGSATQSFVQGLIDAIVAILKVRPAPAAA